MNTNRGQIVVRVWHVLVAIVIVLLAMAAFTSDAHAKGMADEPKPACTVSSSWWDKLVGNCVNVDPGSRQVQPNVQLPQLPHIEPIATVCPAGVGVCVPVIPTQPAGTCTQYQESINLCDDGNPNTNPK